MYCFLYYEKGWKERAQKISTMYESQISLSKAQSNKNGFFTTHIRKDVLYEAKTLIPT